MCGGNDPRRRQHCPGAKDGAAAREGDECASGVAGRRVEAADDARGGAEARVEDARARLRDGLEDELGLEGAVDGGAGAADDEGEVAFFGDGDRVACRIVLADREVELLGREVEGGVLCDEVDCADVGLGGGRGEARRLGGADDEEIEGRVSGGRGRRVDAELGQARAGGEGGDAQGDACAGGDAAAEAAGCDA